MKVFILILFFPCCLIAQAQTDFSRLSDDLIGVVDEDNDDEQRFENIALLLANPLDLNKVTEEEFRQLNILNENQLKEFFKYRSEQGKFLSTYELQIIPSFDASLVNVLAPVVTVQDQQRALNTSFLKRIFSEGNSYWITRYERTLEEKAGYREEDKDKRYRGNADRLYTRFRSSRPGDFSFGFTAEKDPGEKLQWNPSGKLFGADFISGHIQILNKGFIKNLVAGDFQASFAQGVIQGGVFGLGKGSESVTTTRKSSIGFTPHTSASESGFYRGAAATFQLFRGANLSAFYSSVPLDATIEQNDDGKNFISAFKYSGSHRNADELMTRWNAREKAAGAALQFRKNNLDGGAIVQMIEYSLPLQKTENVYNQFTFSGQQNINTGIFLNYSINNFTLFAEGAQSLYAGRAVVAGALASLSPKFDFSLLARSFDKNYYSFHANAFSENTQPQNEKGFYWGWKYRWNRKFNFSGYFDLFRFPWLAFRRYKPAEGFEWLSRLTYAPSRKITMFVQVRQEQKPRNISAESPQYQIEDGTKSNYWFSFVFGENALKLKTRVQYSTYEQAGKISDGMVIVQGLSFSVGRFQLAGHYALFSTDDFDNRQYVYENDVWLAFSFPAYDGEGVRQMAMIDYQVSKKISASFRIARTQYDDREEIGSGSETIRGNTKNDIKFQTIFRF